MAKARKKPIKVDFSDEAKQAAGLTVSTFQTKLAALEQAHHDAQAVLKVKYDQAIAAIRAALAASDEGRRGDCAKILRGALPVVTPPPSNPPNRPTERMMAVMDNLDGAITFRLRQLRGEAPSGNYWQKNADGQYELRARGGEHVMDVHGDRCERCRFSRVELEDGFAPMCAGRPPRPGEAIFEDSRSLTVHIDTDEWECRTTLRIDKRRDVAAQWREVKRMIAGDKKPVAAKYKFTKCVEEPKPGLNGESLKHLVRTLNEEFARQRECEMQKAYAEAFAPRPGAAPNVLAPSLTAVQQIQQQVDRQRLQQLAEHRQQIVDRRKQMHDAALQGALAEMKQQQLLMNPLLSTPCILGAGSMK